MGKKAPEASFPSGEHSGFSIGFSELHGVPKPNPPQSPQRDPTPKASPPHLRKILAVSEVRASTFDLIRHSGVERIKTDEKQSKGTAIPFNRSADTKASLQSETSLRPQTKESTPYSH
ncbi:unnamed protein product [Brassica napus]|uniref:(rape) hypothetical protein n=1 Tax=Brassica napus TaxID=3708 RepID=A0A817B535_BRANA|nr:unnamed protein product [Brassica napus]